MMTDDAIDYLATPIGQLRIVANDQGVCEIRFVETAESPNLEVKKRTIVNHSAVPQLKTTHPILTRCKQQLAEYFLGQRETFDLPLAPTGSEFQQNVWQQLCHVGFGETRSYADIAEQVGRPKAVRAVGSANGRNPISIIIPCHRIIGSNGKLTGYAGGLHRKAWLLNHERRDLLSL